MVNQNLQGLFCKVAFQMGGPQQVLVHGIVPPQVQDFALPFVEHPKVSVRPFVQALAGSPTLWCTSYSSQFCVISGHAEAITLPHHLDI